MLRSVPSGSPSAARLFLAAVFAAALAAPLAAQTPAEGAPGQPAPGQRAQWAAPRTDGATLRVIAEDASSVTVEVTASWPVTLAEALARAGASPESVTPATFAVAASGSQTDVSHEVSLASRVPPAVEKAR